MRLPTKDSLTYKGLVTSAQAFLGALVVFGTGLLGVIHGVPGCYEAIISFLQANAIQYAVALGVPAGIASIIWNLILRRNELKTY